MRYTTTGYCLALLLGCQTAAAAAPKADDTASLMACFPTDQQMLDGSTKCGAKDPFVAAAQLQKEGKLDAMFDLYRTSHNAQQKLNVLTGLYSLDGQPVADFMSSGRNSQLTEDNYFRVMYAAKLGDKGALRMLNDHFFDWPTSSLELSYSAELFGHFKYIPAAPNLIMALDAASLNLEAAAEESLRAMFPGTPNSFSGPQDAQKYFSDRYWKLTGKVPPAPSP